MNAYSKAMQFELPSCREGWLRVIDTALPPGDDLPATAEPWQPCGARLQSRSLMVLVAAPLLHDTIL